MPWALSFCLALSFAFTSEEAFAQGGEAEAFVADIIVLTTGLAIGYASIHLSYWLFFEAPDLYLRLRDGPVVAPGIFVRNNPTKAWRKSREFRSEIKNLFNEFSAGEVDKPTFDERAMQLEKRIRVSYEMDLAKIEGHHALRSTTSPKATKQYEQLNSELKALMEFKAHMEFRALLEFKFMQSGMRTQAEGAVHASQPTQKKNSAVAAMVNACIGGS